MLFPKRDQRAMDHSKAQRRRRAEEQQDGDERPLSDEMEKGDLPAMIISALLVLLPIALVVLVVMALVGKWAMHL